MSQVVRAKNPGLISYKTLRRVTGGIGISLPFVLALVNMLLVSNVILQGSVSGYYYTGVRDVLVGSLCAIGVFLFSYSGYDDWDKWLTNAAGLFAIGVALFPTAPVNASASAKAVGYVHLTCAALLFITLAVIALWLFRKTEPTGERTPEKRNRDRVYLICGSLIALCVVLVPIESLVIGAPIAKYQPLFWLEAVAIVAFGVAWLVKGETVFRDKKRSAGTAPAEQLAKPVRPGPGLAERMAGSRPS
jgi:hypothetical protein